jgi:hypothetical protein
MEAVREFQEWIKDKVIGDPQASEVFTVEQLKEKGVVGVYLPESRMNARTEVYAAVSDERVYQERKWGTIEEHPHEVGGWLTIMRKLLTNAETAWVTSRGDIGALEEIRQVVAVGVACMEQHGAIPRSAADFAKLGNTFDVSKAN